MGVLIVNLPVTTIIILSVFVCGQIGLEWNSSLFVGIGIGLFCWGKLTTKWKNWGLDNNVSRERLYRLGKIGLINFYRYKIFDEEAK